MTRFELLFGLASLLPAAVNPTPARHTSLVVGLCTSAGVVLTARLPAGPADLPGTAAPGCCAKGCHSGASRRRGRGRLDPSQ